MVRNENNIAIQAEQEEDLICEYQEPTESGNAGPWLADK